MRCSAWPGCIGNTFWVRSNATRERAEQARELAGAVLADLGLQLHPRKTGIAHLARGGQGFDFLGFHHQKVESWRHRGRFHLQRWPSQRAMQVLRDKIRAATDRRQVGRPLSAVVADVMTGIDTGIDFVCLIGYHGKAGTAHSVLAHTISGSTIAAVRCNGRELGELGLNVALAAHYGAPTVLATGDDTLVHEAELTVPGITTVEVKRADGNRAAEGLHPREACSRIEAGTQRALRNPPAPEVWFEGAVDLEVDMHKPVMTEIALLIPGVEARGPLTLGFSAADIAIAYDLIEVFTVLGTNA